MQPLNLNSIVVEYVEKNIEEFHKSRLEALNKLKLKDVLKRKNPYLFKAKNILYADEIVKSITDAYISSQEETIFGNWLEGLAIFINGKVYRGSKSGIQGIDLEFKKDKEDGGIDWEKLVKFNSSKNNPKINAKKRRIRL